MKHLLPFFHATVPSTTVEPDRQEDHEQRRRLTATPQRTSFARRSLRNLRTYVRQTFVRRPSSIEVKQRTATKCGSTKSGGTFILEHESSHMTHGLTTELGSDTTVFSMNAVSAFEITYNDLTDVQQFYLSTAKQKGPTYPGDVVIASLLLKCKPEARQIFDSCDEDGKYDYVSMEKRFSLCIDYIVRQLTVCTDDSLSEYLTNLGRKHVLFTALTPTTIDAQMWSCASDALINLAQEWPRSRQRLAHARNTWSKIVLYIVTRMRDGYYAEVGATNSHRPSMTPSNTSPARRESRQSHLAPSCTPQTAIISKRASSLRLDDTTTTTLTSGCLLQVPAAADGGRRYSGPM